MIPLWLLKFICNSSGDVDNSCPASGSSRFVAPARTREDLERPSRPANDNSQANSPRTSARHATSLQMSVPVEKLKEIAAIQDEKERERRAAKSRQRVAEEEAAAAIIQRNYRGYRDRRHLRGIGLSASTRWLEALKEVQYRNRIQPRSRGERSSMSSDRARENWKRVGAIATRAGADDTSETEGDEDMTLEQLEEYRRKKHEAKIEREKTAKMMDLQYFLEMVDDKHRYGSNLRAYHQEWMKSDTHENFFNWLDRGDGRNLNLPIVPRERLDSERVRYLSREERQKYLVKVDKEGRLCWARNGERITTSIEYKDTVDGVMPKEDAEHKPWSAYQRRGSFSSDSSSSILSAGSAEAEGEHYVNHDLTKAKGLKKLKHVSAATILNRLLQKSVRPNSWIFVADTSFRLYVGIKQSGAFQHSSFLHGARISAAGLIKIKDGQLRRLSPLSGHYRPPTSNFRQFVHSLREEGVDMSRVSISRSYAVLVGLEAYVRTRKKIKHGIHHVEEEKEKVLHPEEVRRREEESMDKSKSAEKERKILQAEAQKQEELKRRTGFGTRLLRKLKLRSRSKSAKTGVNSTVTPIKAPLSASGEDIESGIPPAGER